MPLKPWKKIRQVLELKNPWWTYCKDEVELPLGKKGEYHFVHVNGSSMIIPLMDDGRLIMINQYRYLAQKESLEFPCGSVKDGATYEETARHELAEETGFEAENLSLAAEFNPYNGVTDEMCRVYIAKNLKPIDAKPDDTEEFEQVFVTINELEKKIQSGDIWDGMTLAAWVIIKNQLMK